LKDTVVSNLGGSSTPSHLASSLYYKRVCALSALLNYHPATISRRVGETLKTGEKYSVPYASAVRREFRTAPMKMHRSLDLSSSHQRVIHRDGIPLLCCYRGLGALSSLYFITSFKFFHYEFFTWSIKCREYTQNCKQMEKRAEKRSSI